MGGGARRSSRRTSPLTAQTALSTGRAAPTASAASVAAVDPRNPGRWAAGTPPCAGIQRTVKLTDALIAATAIDLGLPVVAQDDDYDQMARAHRALHVLKV